MGNYNPSRPMIMGNEWVPIHDERYEMDQFVERGYSFKQVTTGVAQRGEYFLSEVPTGTISSQCPLVSVYRKGNETMGAPIRKIVVPCSSAVDAGTHGSFFGDLTGAPALQNPSDGSGFSFTTGTISTTASGNLTLAFDTSTLASIMVFSPRILNVSFIYTVVGDTAMANSLGPPFQFFWQSIRFQGLANDLFYGTGVLDSGISGRGDLTTQIGRLSFGEMNANWNNAGWPGVSDWYPWTKTRLALFDEAEVTNPLRVYFQWSIDNTVNSATTPTLYYAALEITYATLENRLMYGGRHIGYDFSQNTPPIADANYGVGTNFVILRQAETLVTGGVLRLDAGNEYTVTTNLADLGDLAQPLFGINALASTNTRPTIHALRELYEVDAMVNVKVRRPFTVADTFHVTRDEHIIPTVGITVTGASPVSQVTPESHGYSIQVPAYAVPFINVQQTIVQDNLRGPLSYPWVRFYARSIGEGGLPTDALNFQDAVVTARNVQITRADLLALPEIVDGWREVTLRFPVGQEPIMHNAGGTQTYQWYVSSLITSDFDNSFEVIGADGIYTDLSNATYQTTAGVMVGIDVTPNMADASVLFSTDPPAVTGLGVSSQFINVTGIGTNCAGASPACIPSLIFYNRVTWSTASVALTGGIPVTGFGYYELQRLDAVDNIWQTIMKATSPAVTGFNDWESRIGIQSSYRIRVVNKYQIGGPWSVTVNATTPSPALFMGGGNHELLLFTTNSEQSGNRSLAYEQVWDSDPVSEMSYFEGSGMVQFQRMYQRDFQVGFHGTERGGVQFQRTLLVQNAAVAAPVLENAFKSLRDLAWDDAPYVCVRTDVGDRWYATVEVPSGTIQRNRTLQLVQIRVTETTETPVIIDPVTQV